MPEPVKLKVLSKNKIERSIEGFIGVAFKDISKGKISVIYGMIGLVGRY